METTPFLAEFPWHGCLQGLLTAGLGKPPGASRDVGPGSAQDGPPTAAHPLPRRRRPGRYLVDVVEAGALVRPVVVALPHIS